MRDSEHWQVVEQVVSANDGTLVGKTRLQKTIYLLQALGLGTSYDFEYHHYGPYAEGLAEDVEWAKFLGNLKTKEKPGHHQVPYTIFETTQPAPTVVGELSFSNAKSVLIRLEKYPAVVLELAATLHFLRASSTTVDAEKELKIRKPDKAASERLANAKSLLRELGL